MLFIFNEKITIIKKYVSSLIFFVLKFPRYSDFCNLYIMFLHIRKLLISQFKNYISHLFFFFVSYFKYCMCLQQLIICECDKKSLVLRQWIFFFFYFYEAYLCSIRISYQSIVSKLATWIVNSIIRNNHLIIININN
jgi:hypothetical protein